MSDDPRNAHEKLLALLTVRDARDTLERAIFWTVSCSHIDSEGVRTLYGAFTEPSGALAHAAGLEAELNVEGEEGFRCVVLPIMPVT